MHSCCQKGYYRSPTIFGETLAFVSDDDVWAVRQGQAVRLTSGLAESLEPCFSPDGKWIAFTGFQEGHGEVYLMPSEGGSAQRMTFISEGSTVVGWHGGDVLFSSTKGTPFRTKHIYRLNVQTGEYKVVPCGPANFMSFGPKGHQSVIQRHGYGYVSWKRYRGGTAGEIWIDKEGTGDFQKLLTLDGNVLRPLWIKGRIYFISDHEGHGNVYSVTPEGQDLTRHTSHEDYFVRGIHSDGNSLVYSAGGDIWYLDLLTNMNGKVDFTYATGAPQRARKFVDAAENLSHLDLDHGGERMAFTSRGRPFTMANWEGAPTQWGERDGVRYKSVLFLKEGSLLVVKQIKGTDVLEKFPSDPSKKSEVFGDKEDFGRILWIKASPQGEDVALVNHRCELVHFNLKKKKSHLIEAGVSGESKGFDWSPDGKWLAYDVTVTRKKRAIKLYEVDKKKSHPVTNPVLEDYAPHFDPEGRYLYFLSKRTFKPVPDNMQFDLGFPRGSKAYLVTLERHTPSPFEPRLDAKKATDEDPKEKKGAKPPKDKPLTIDLEGIEDRIVEFPLPEGDYVSIKALASKVLLLSRPLASFTGREEEDVVPGLLQAYDFEQQKSEDIAKNVTTFLLSGNRESMAYVTGDRVRVVRAGEKPQDNDQSYRKGGWIRLSRIRISVDPGREWKQMFDEAWQLQKDFFWTADMSKIDWDEVYNRYAPLLDHVATRGELSDLIAEMHGELGSSHAYVFGGDYRETPEYPLGELGCDFEKTTQGYKILNITRGDPWDGNGSSPLVRPGAEVKNGEILVAVGGVSLKDGLRPEPLLVNQAGNCVDLTIQEGRKKPRIITVKTLHQQTLSRYRDWVEKNRAEVHARTQGRVGYIHIPDMSQFGYAEFHRYFLQELDAEGLIVDVRYNGGGNVSQLLLDKLSRRRLGYDKTRWYGDTPYPDDAPMGPMVALTNEYAGSDGDMFSHCFKMMGLGPLIGKRTWGGVIGIWTRHPLVDGGMTSQPEFSFWFHDVGWSIENYGVDPDIVVEITPQDYVQGRDPQLDRGLLELENIMKENPGLKPAYTEKPDLRVARFKTLA